MAKGRPEDEIIRDEIDSPELVDIDDVARILGVKDDVVLFRQGSFYMFSNFSSFKVLWLGIDWMTSEHAYQALKFRANSPIFNKIKNARSAYEAKRIAKLNKDKEMPEFQELKRDIMRRIVRAKIQQHPYIQRKLLETGNKELVEDSPTDPFWGRGRDWAGRNELGKIWMELREELRSF